MRVISILLMLCVSGCGQMIAAETETAKCFAASELALFQRDATPVVNVIEPPKQTCQCNGTHYVTDNTRGRLQRKPCPCGQSCKCIGSAPQAVADKKPELIFWSAKWCKPCKPILAELEACKSELPFVVVVKDNDEKRPAWVESLPTLHWSIGFNQWRSFSPSKETPWPGVDGFVRMYRKSFPHVAQPPPLSAPASLPYGVGAGKFPIRATVQQLKQLLSAKGLALPYGMSVKCLTGGLVASVSQAGQDVLIVFDDSALPQVSFNGKVRSARIGETKGSIVIDGLPDVTFEVTP